MTSPYVRLKNDWFFNSEQEINNYTFLLCGWHRPLAFERLFHFISSSQQTCVGNFVKSNYRWGNWVSERLSRFPKVYKSFHKLCYNANSFSFSPETLWKDIKSLLKILLDLGCMDPGIFHKSSKEEFPSHPSFSVYVSLLSGRPSLVIKTGLADMFYILIVPVLFLCRIGIPL